MYRLCKKLKHFKVELKALNLQAFSHLKLRVEAARKALREAQLNLERDPMNTALRSQEQTVLKNFKSVQPILLAQQ